MSIIIEEKKWLVVPPKITKEELSMFMIDIESLANSEDEAWHMFLFPSLVKSAYEKDGFKAINVVVQVEIIKNKKN